MIGDGSNGSSWKIGSSDSAPIRDSGTLGALITRHISEFDRTVKTFGGEIVDRMGQRTQDIAETLRGYIDTFDSRLTLNGGEITASLDQRLMQFETTLGDRVTRLDASLDNKLGTFDSSLGGRIHTLDTALERLSDAIHRR